MNINDTSIEKYTENSKKIFKEKLKNWFCPPMAKCDPNFY